MEVVAGRGGITENGFEYVTYSKLHQNSFHTQYAICVMLLSACLPVCTHYLLAMAVTILWLTRSENGWLKSILIMP